jgi:hypothetical protein
MLRNVVRKSRVVFSDPFSDLYRYKLLSLLSQGSPNKLHHGAQDLCVS